MNRPTCLPETYNHPHNNVRTKKEATEKLALRLILVVQRAEGKERAGRLVELCGRSGGHSEYKPARKKQRKNNEREASEDFALYRGDRRREREMVAAVNCYGEVEEN